MDVSGGLRIRTQLTISTVRRIMSVGLPSGLREDE